jgi:predicted negative regulator of RcsB-dependent stress response
MKSEERHRLQQNQLADWIGKTITSIKPYQNSILIVVLLVVVGMAAYTVWSRVSATENTQAWDELNAAMESGNIAKLAKVREDRPNTHVAHVAAVVEADYSLAEGCNSLFVSKAVANQKLAKAVELYRTVLDQSRNSSLLQRATFGLARAREAKGELERAMELYQEVSTKWPDGAFAVAAARRLDDLKRPATKRLYDRFAKFDPKPAYSSESGLPGQRPNFDMKSLPSDGPIPPINTTFDLKLNDKEKAKDKDKEETSKATAEEKTPGAEKDPFDEKTPGAEKAPLEEKTPGVEKAPVEEKKTPADEKKGSEETGK